MLAPGINRSRIGCAPSSERQDLCRAGWVPSLFRRRVQREGTAIALESSTESRTYQTLDQRTDQLGARLIQHGVGPEVLVAVILRRSIGAIESWLSVLKAGGAFLPIDPDYPRDRLRFLLKDSGVRHLITDAATAPHLPETGANVLEIDNLEFAGPSDVLETEGDPESLAYAIYTSGSTGKPKAALLTHRGLGPFADAQATALGIQSGSRVLQFSSLGFDAAISEVFVTLLHGGILCIAEALELVPGPILAKTLVDRRIEVVTLPPSVLSMLPGGTYTHLRTIVSAGEPCSASLVNHWAQGRRFINAYGPTEATVCATLFECAEELSESPPIGKPLPYVDAVVLDESGNPVPDGIAGELCLGGPGLARGYLNRSKLTAERFITDPRSSDPRRRLYRTGDIVDRQKDGNYRYLGRSDDQLKIRGIRIEPGEIRGVLEAIPGIRSAVVLPIGEEGNRTLGAFVLLDHGQHLSTDSINRQLRQRLPIHLIPCRVTIVDRFPLTPHGKLDQRALLNNPETFAQQPDSLTSHRSHPDETPYRDATELQVALEWQELFGVEVGLGDDFFTLGGDSMAALELLTRLERRFGVGLPVASLLESPTVAGIAQELGRHLETASWSPIVPIQRLGNRPPLYCIHPGGGDVLCYLELARTLGLDQPLIGLQAPGVDGTQAPLSSVEAMAAHYLDAIKANQTDASIKLCGWSFGGVVGFEMARRLEAEGCAPDQLFVLDSGFLYAFAVLRALIPSERPLVQYLGGDRQAAWPEFLRSAEQARIVPPNAGLERTRQIFNVFMANVEAMMNYRPGPYQGRVTLLMAEEPFADRRRDPIDEWRRLCPNLEIVTVPGNHLTMLRPPHVARLATQLQVWLDNDSATSTFNGSGRSLPHGQR